MYGRKLPFCIAMAAFVILVIPCAVAKNITTILIVRFFGAIAGSAMIANAPGSVSDIATDKYRALAFSLWSIGPMNGPVCGPLIGGYVTEYLGWRWTNWIVVILGGVGFGMMCLIKETYAPALLRRKAARLRKESADGRYWCRYDEKKSFWPLLKLNLTRPFVMAVKEPIWYVRSLFVEISCRPFAIFVFLLSKIDIYGLAHPFHCLSKHARSNSHSVKECCTALDPPTLFFPSSLSIHLHLIYSLPYSQYLYTHI